MHATPHRVFIPLALLLAGCAGAPSITTVPAPHLAGSDEPRELAVDQQAKHALNRLTYGAKPEDVAAVIGQGLDSWLQRQLTPENWPDSVDAMLAARFPVTGMTVRELVDSSPQLDVFRRRRRSSLGLAANAPYTMTADDSAHYKAMNDLGNRRVQQYLSAKLTRATLSQHQIAELMTDFWENHFSVFRGKMPTQFTLLEYDRDIIRPRALGRFRDLLGAVAHSPAMLYYLDNVQSGADSGQVTLADERRIVAAHTPAESERIRQAALRRRGGLNENYGRELLELHTLGVDGGYTQADVRNAARCLSGWTLETPREGGAFLFNPATHDAGQKVVLGHVFPAGRGIEDGEELLDLLARQPATARFVATKLVRHFVADSAPPSLVRRATARFIETDGDIREVMATIVSSHEFYRRAGFRAKVKTPYELVVSSYRVLGAVPDTLRSVQLAAQLGQPMFGHLTPDGWPDQADAWMNTGSVLARINFGSNAAAGRVPGIVPAKWTFTRVPAGAPRNELVATIAHAVLEDELSPDTFDVMMSGVNPVAAQPGGGAASRPATGVELVGLALGSPEFQRR